MRVINHDNGYCTIDNDEDVLKRLDGVAPGSYPEIDVMSLRLDMDILARLYIKAQTTARPEDADAYRRYKERIKAATERRNIHGEINE